MHQVRGIIGGIGVLIALFLFLSHAGETARIVNTVAENSIKGIQVLQGRSRLVS